MTSVPPSERIVLTVSEAAQVLGIGRSQAYRACRQGDLPTIRIGRRILVSREALSQLVGETHLNRVQKSPLDDSTCNVHSTH